MTSTLYSPGCSGEKGERLSSSLGYRFPDHPVSCHSSCARVGLQFPREGLEWERSFTKIPLRFGYLSTFPLPLYSEPILP